LENKNFVHASFKDLKTKFPLAVFFQDCEM